ncbi:MAG: hypothetical protein P1P86_10215 [Bacteroidales bacterium]|nr:hypothetical protein [Bacteroidales bacterium]
MRKIFIKPVILLSLIAFAVFVSSCNKSQDIDEADLIGTWDIGQASVDIKVGPISLFQFVKTTLQFSDQEAQDLVDELASEFDEFGGTITFNADYSYQMLHGDFAENGTWELDEEKLYMTKNGEMQEDDPMTVESLDSSSALISWKEDQEVDITEDGSSDFTATLVIELNLSKQ